MKAVRRISRKAARPKGEDNEAAKSSRGSHADEEKKSIRSRSLSRGRSHIMGLARRRERAQAMNQPEASQQQHVDNTSRSTTASTEATSNLGPRKSTEWKVVTSELHRRMEQHEQQDSLLDNGRNQQPQFEISPAARTVLAKKDQQRKGSNTIKATNSIVSGRSRNTHNSTSRLSDQRPPSRTRNQARARPRLTDIKSKGPTHSWTEESLSTMPESIPRAVIGGGDMNERPTAHGKQPAIKDTTASAGTDNSQRRSKKSQTRHPVEPATTKRRDTSRSKSTQQVNPSTPVLKPKGAMASDRSVASKVSSIAASVPTTSALPIKKTTGVEQKVELRTDTVKIILADRKAANAGRDAVGDCEETKEAEGDVTITENGGSTAMASSSSSYFIFACTNPLVDPEENRLGAAEARALKHKMWLEYAKKAIYEAKHGIEEATPESFNRRSPRAVVKQPPRAVIKQPPRAAVESVMEIQESGDSGVVDESSDEDDDVRSISSVDLLMRWIGNCGEPDLSDHYPATQQQKLALHQAAKTQRGPGHPQTHRRR